MTDLQQLMDDIRAWSDKQFGDGQRNPAIAYHLQKEVPELIEALTRYIKEERFNFIHYNLNPDSDRPREIDTLEHRVCYEFADCFMLLLDSASHFGLSANALLLYTRNKLEVNKSRRWGKPDENGVIEHIENE